MTHGLFNQLKVVRTTLNHEDPAIDMDKTELGKYLETREEKHLVFVEGQSPDWFYLDRLSAMTMLALHDKVMSPDMKATTAFLAGCHKITLANGEVLTPEKYLAGDKQKLATDDWVIKISDEFGLPVVLEMGRLILKLSSMGKRTKVAFF